MKKLLLVLSLLATSASTSLFAYEKGVNVKAYPKSDMLISAEEAIKLIGKKNVMFVSGDSEDSYPNQHIKGSVVMGAHHLHHSNIMGQMHCAPLYQCVKDAEKLIGHKGIDNNTLVIAYDDYRGPNSTGVYSFFKSYGHKKVKLLMGGFKAINALDPAKKQFDSLKKKLRKAGKPIKLAKNVTKYAKKLAKAEKSGDAEKIANYKKSLAKAKKKANKLGDVKAAVAKANVLIANIKKKMDATAKKLLIVKSRPLTDAEKKMTTHHVVSILEAEEGVHHKHYKINPKRVSYKGIASKADVLHAVHDIQKKGKRSKYIIVDARGMTEIIGERKMDNVGRGGHIPGSTFMEWKNISDNKRGVALKTPAQLKAVFKKYGITKDKTIYAYCHVGAGRGSEVVTALEAMGYKNAKVYTGSWDEWGNDLSLPVKR